MVAICIGSMGLAAICKAYASNYKHFYGGAPDLLLVRVKKVFKQRTSDTSHGSGTDSNLDRNKVEVSTQIVPLEELLGVNWKTYGNILIDSEDKDWNSLLPTKKNDSRGYIPAEQINADGTTDMNEGWESEQGDNEPEPKDDATFSQNLCEIQLPEARFICNSLDDFQNCTNQDDFHGEQSFLGLCCEVFFVEVKGPTDHLAYRQYVWLQILATHNRAAVCFVKEKSLKMLMEKEGKALLKIGEDVEI